MLEIADLNPRSVKTSKMSLGRAYRNQPFLTATMFALIAAWDDELFHIGILKTSCPPTGELTPAMGGYGEQ